MKEVQASDSIKLGLILSLSGGFMDAYSYLGRGQVFANAQTGNLVLLGVNLANGNFDKLTRYLIPVLFFMLGVLIALWQKYVIKKLHWRQVVLLLEIICFLIVPFIPYSQNVIANGLISFACGMQVEAFKKIWNHQIATTMCIGNMRSATENLFIYTKTKNKLNLERSLICFLVILVFIIGAILGDFALKYMHEYAILVCPILLGIGFILMHFSNNKSTL